MNSGYAHGAFQSPIDGRGAKRFARRMSGFTLIELIIFIVVSGILAVGLAGVFSSSMRGGAEPGRLTQATQIAQERMELILEQKRRLGFAAFVAAANFDPCNPGPGPACTPPAGYSFVPAPTRVIGWVLGDPVNYAVITVTVVGPDALTVTLTAVVSAYI